MLSFLSPLFLAGAALASVPILLHLLKREPEARVKFAAVRMLKRAPVEHTEKRHLRELLLLALRVAALVLLALAFARPFFASGAALTSSAVTVVALDTSYSVSTPERAARAKQLAKDAVSHAPAGSLVGVVTFADEAEIAAKPGVDRVLAEAAIEQAAPARSWSSPICRRTGGTPATVSRSRRGRRSKSRMWVRYRRTWRSPRSGRCPTGSSRRFTTAGRARATRACT